MPSPLQVEGRIVAPVVAAPLLRPVERARADIHHLRLVADEGVAGDRVALGPGGEMDADMATLEPVAGEAVLVGVVDEHAFVAAAHDIAFDARVVGVVEQQRVIAIAVATRCRARETVGIHHGIADIVADRDVVGHLAVVGVHEMHRETQVVEAVARAHVLSRLVTENTPSRPERMSLSSIREPGVFHSETAGPRSLRWRRSRRPSMRLCRTIASCGPSR